ncbi:MAG: hypothetical protein V1831_02960 [Candidatus Woesearchaeota archaeon]
MATTYGVIAKQTIDDTLIKEGFNPKDVYRLVKTLDNNPLLTNVRLAIPNPIFGLSILADYTGNPHIEDPSSYNRSIIADIKRYLDPSKDSVLNKVFDNLKEQTGIEMTKRRYDPREWGLLTATVMSSKNHDIELWLADAYAPSTAGK